MAEDYPSDATLVAMEGTTLSPGLPVPDDTTDPHLAQAIKAMWRVAKGLVAVAGCEVYKDDADPLQFGVRAGLFMVGAREVSYAGAAGQALTNNQTNYIYLTVDGALTVNITGFPDQESTPHFPLATILTAAGVYDFSDIVDYRGRLLFNIGACRPMLMTAKTCGVWGYDTDEANTNGGGIVGTVTRGEITLTEAAAAYCKVYDAGTTAYANLSVSATLPGWAANYQLTPDAASEAVDDAAYFGNDVPFPEISFDLAGGAAQLAQWGGGDGGLYEYWDGAAWQTLTLVADFTDTTAVDGKRPWQRTGTVTFIPPADWAACAVDSQTAYWIRWRFTAANCTQAAITDAKEHQVVHPTHGIMPPIDGYVDALRGITCAAAGPTAPNDVKFIVVNFTNGEVSEELTWSHTQGIEAWAAIAGTGSGSRLTFDAGDSLGILVTDENGVQEVEHAVLEFSIVPR